MAETVNQGTNNETTANTQKRTFTQAELNVPLSLLTGETEYVSFFHACIHRKAFLQHRSYGGKG